MPSTGVAPSATTTIEKFAPRSWRCVIRVADLVDVEGRLGDEDHVGAAREPRVGRDPTRVAAHHLHDHHPVVALGGRVQPIDRVGRDLHRGVEPEREVGRREVVVDRLRDADHLHAVARQLVRDAERVLAADRDHRVDAVALRAWPCTRAGPSSVLYGFVRDVPRIVPPRGSSPRTDSSVSGTDSPSIEPAPAVPVADDLVLEVRGTLAHHGADHRVEARAVTTAREHADTHQTRPPDHCVEHRDSSILRRAPAEWSDAEVS